MALNRPRPEPAEQLASFAEALLQIAEMAATVREAVAGYRAQLEADGHPSPVVDAMAIQYHGFVLQVIVASILKGGQS